MEGNASRRAGRAAKMPEPVDLARLSRQTLGEEALAREVLDLFCTQSAVYLQRLRQALSGSDWREAAHALKGAAAGIGAWKVARAAERAEALKDASLIEGRDTLFMEIETAISEAVAFIQNRLRQNRTGRRAGL